MRRRLLLVGIVSCLLSFCAESQTSNTTWPKALLWRISGNGLQKPSFLYGTMHLQDRRIFNFGDSVYKYLEAVEGFAMEVDLQDMMDSVLQQAVDKGMDEYIERLDNKRKKKLVDSLIVNVREFKDKASMKKLEKMRTQRMRAAMKNKEMPTIVDAFLMGIARRQDKWVGGIEDVGDQISVLNEMGRDITSDELLAPQSEAIASLEKLIRIYLAKDLGQIEKFELGNMSEKMEDLIFLRRNIKMARRMDSLSRIRTMFFAVGAAHLPGDSGVINLLKGRGYLVEPVYSKETIDPLKYLASLKVLPWFETQDEKKTYSVQLPGKATSLTMFGGLLPVKFYADMMTLTYFMAGSIPVPKSADINKIIASLTENNSDAVVLNKKAVERDNAKGMGLTMITNGYYYRIEYLLKENLIYMLLVGGENEKQLTSPDAAKFLQSFKATGKGFDESTAGVVVPVDMKNKGFSVSFPGKPNRNRLLEKKAEGTQWQFTVLDLLDQRGNCYYMMQVRDIRPGYYMMSDTSYFSGFRKNMETAIVNDVIEKREMLEKYRAYFLEGSSADRSLFYKTINILRGNRVYTLLAGGENNAETLVSIDRFLESFKMTEYETQAWKIEESEAGGFSSMVPAPFLLPNDTKENLPITDEFELFVSYDSTEINSYQVIKTPLSEYFWVENDSALYAQLSPTYINYDDSILLKQEVKNGKLSGMEWHLLTQGSSQVKKLRMVPNGDTLYSLLCMDVLNAPVSSRSQEFLDQFRVKREDTKRNYLTSKAPKLFSDLASIDSAKNARANEAFIKATFASKDLPVLHKALLQNYLDDATDYYNTRDRIANKMEGIADQSTIAFIREQYPLLQGERENVKFVFLGILATMKTTESYAVLKQLLLSSPPKFKLNNELSGRITDSLELAITLFPEILKLASNELVGIRVIDITQTLVEKKKLSIEIVRPFEDSIYKQSENTFENLKGKVANEDYYLYDFNSMIDLLGDLGTPKAFTLLRKWLTHESADFRQKAALALLRNRQVVEPAVLESIAADRTLRRELYDSLKNMGKAELFPRKYNTQRLLADSDMWINAMDDDYEPDSLVFIGEKIAMLNGKRSKFYLYRVIFDNEDEESEYLGVAGPFELDVKKTENDGSGTGVNFEESFDKKKIDKLFADHLRAYTRPDR